MKNVLDRLFPTLGSKIAISLSLVFFMVGGSFIFLAYRTGHSMLKDIARAKAFGIAEFGKSVFERNMFDERGSHVKDALESAITSHQATEVIVLKEDGSIAMSMSSDGNFPNLQLHDFKSSREYEDVKFLSIKEKGLRYEYVMIPIVKKPECFRCHQQTEKYRGYLVAKVSVDDLYQIALQHRTMNTIMMLITFIGLGGVVFTALLFLVIRPVKKLHSQMQQMEKQLESFEAGEKVEFSEHQTPHTHDEIANLITIYNKLVRKLNQAHTKLREMHAEQLVHADRLATVGEMAASIAHEIKNPIAGVLGALQELNSEMVDDDTHKDIMKEMILQMERMGRTVNDLLYFARPTTPVFELVNVNRKIERTLSILRPQYEGRNITTRLLLDSTLPDISGDLKLLQQLFWNILANAIQAMEREGALTITTAKEHLMVSIQIQDTGKGISKNHQSSLFKPFFTTKHKGTGLGLAISRRIVEQHNGRISIESVEGKGTTVTILLPTAESI